MTPRKNLLPPLHPIHPRTQVEVKAGSRVVIRDASGEHHDRVALSGVERGHDFLVVWVVREEEWAAARGEHREPDGVPWPAEDVWIPGDEPREAREDRES